MSQAVEVVQTETIQAPEAAPASAPAPAPEEMSDADRILVADALLREGDEEAPTEEQAEETEETAEPKESAPAETKGRKQERDLADEELLESGLKTERSELQRLRQLEKEKDAAYAQLRRMDNHNRAQQAENERRARDLEAREKVVSEAESYKRMVKENPVTAFERIAEDAGMKPSELLDRVQRRYINGGQPGADEQFSEVRALREMVAKLNDKIDGIAQAPVKQHEAQQTQQEKQGQQQLIATTIEKQAMRWPLMAKLREVNPDEFGQSIANLVESVHQGDGTYTVGEIADYLEGQERRWYESRKLPYGSEQGSAPGDEQKAVSGTGPQAKARKPAAARSVTAIDAANGSGARRELTEQERMQKADRQLRTAFFGTPDRE